MNVVFTNRWSSKVHTGDFSAYLIVYGLLKYSSRLRLAKLIFIAVGSMFGAPISSIHGLVSSLWYKTQTVPLDRFASRIVHEIRNFVMLSPRTINLLDDRVRYRFFESVSCFGSDGGMIDVIPRVLECKTNRIYFVKYPVFTKC